MKDQNIKDCDQSNLANLAAIQPSDLKKGINTHVSLRYKVLERERRLSLVLFADRRRDLLRNCTYFLYEFQPPKMDFLLVKKKSFTSDFPMNSQRDKPFLKSSFFYKLICVHSCSSQDVIVDQGVHLFLFLTNIVPNKKYVTK